MPKTSFRKNSDSPIRFYNAVDLINQLDREKQQGTAGNLTKQLIGMDAVILDELGYLPFPASGGALLFHLISQLFEKTSLITTTNLNFAGPFRAYRDLGYKIASQPMLGKWVKAAMTDSIF